MGLPPFEPLQVPQVNIVQGKESAIAVELNFRDCEFFGISQAIINKTV